MPRLKKSFRNKFVAEQIKKICLGWSSLDYIEGLFAIEGKTPPQEIYLELIDVMVKRNEIDNAIRAGKKTGRRGVF